MAPARPVRRVFREFARCVYCGCEQAVTGDAATVRCRNCLHAIVLHRAFAAAPPPPSIAVPAGVRARPATVQRANRTGLSMWVNVVVMFGAAVALARLGGPATPVDERVQAELRALAGLAEEFRARHGSYPDAETWRRTTKEADSRFLDPWGRPYRYARDAGGTTIGTLGRDGRPAGRGEDADVSLTLPSPRS